MIIKVCGMKNANNIRNVEQAGADWIGFIFYPPSPRYIEAKPDYLPQTSKRVGVFVNQAEEEVLRYAIEYRLDYIQLHGTESADYCVSLHHQGLRLIKAFSISCTDDLRTTQAYESICSFFLFDTPSKVYGGSGQTFPWELLKEYTGKTPFILSGGISPQHVKRVKSFSHPQCVGIDLNSCFETVAGMKDTQLIKQFINQIKENNNE